jgi:signal transduction histidine kinase
MVEKAKKWAKNGFTLKIVSVILPLTAIFVALLVIGFFTMVNLRGDATSINYSGQLRYRSFQLALLINEYPSLQGAARDKARNDITQLMEEFEGILYGLRDGNKDLGLKGFKPPKNFEEGIFNYNDSWWQFDRHINNYQERIKPLILHILATNTPEEARGSLKAYNKEIPAFVADVDRTVHLLNSLSEEKISRFNKTNFILLGLFLGIVGGVFSLASFFIRRPILDILRGTIAFGRGNLDYRIPVRTNDEIGALAQSFNEMAESIKEKMDVQRDRNLLSNVLGNIGCFVRIVDPKVNRVFFQNEPLQAICPQGLERPCYTVLGRDKKCDYCTSLEAIEKNKYFRKEEETPGGAIFEVNSFPLPDPDGTLTKAIEVVRDITATKKMEREMEESRNLLSSVLSNIGCFVRIVDPKAHRVFFQNEPLQAIFPQGLEKPCYAVLGKDKECDYCTSLEAITKNKNFRKEAETPGGAIFEVNSFPLPNPDGTLTRAIEVVRDITATKKMEKEMEESRMELLQAQKMATFGHLGVGLAHHLNNPLSGINLSTETLLKTVAEIKDGPVYANLKEHLTRIKEAGMRCEAALKDFLKMSRMPKPKKLPISLNEVIEHVLNVMSPQLEASKVQLVKALSSAIPNIHASHTQLETVFMNVLYNALVAMPEGSTMTLKTEYLDGEEEVGAIVSYTGCEISKEDLPHVFDPYFMLKIRPSTKCTGLELPLAQTIVQAHDGTIEADSEEGKGVTTFRVRLPIYKEDPSSEKGAPGTGVVI